MTQQRPEDFTGESEVDDSTQLAQRRRDRAEPAGESEVDDSTQLAQRRQPLVEADLDEETRMALRRADGATAADVDLGADDRESDVTRVASRHSAADTVPPRTKSTQTDAAETWSPHAGRDLSPLPPGQAPAGLRVQQGGFGSRTAAYGPRAVSEGPLIPPPPVATPLTPQHREPVLAPAEAQRRRESAHRASVGKAVAVAVAVLVVGTTAVIGIVLLVRGLG